MWKRPFCRSLSWYSTRTHVTVCPPCVQSVGRSRRTRARTPGSGQCLLNHLVFFLNIMNQAFLMPLQRLRPPANILLHGNCNGGSSTASWQNAEWGLCYFQALSFLTQWQDQTYFSYFVCRWRNWISLTKETGRSAVRLSEITVCQWVEIFQCIALISKHKIGYWDVKDHTFCRNVGKSLSDSPTSTSCTRNAKSSTRR